MKEKASYPKNTNKVELFLAFRQRAKKFIYHYFQNLGLKGKKGREVVCKRAYLV